MSKGIFFQDAVWKWRVHFKMLLELVISTLFPRCEELLMWLKAIGRVRSLVEHLLYLAKLVCCWAGSFDNCYFRSCYSYLVNLVESSLGFQVLCIFNLRNRKFKTSMNPIINSSWSWNNTPDFGGSKWNENKIFTYILIICLHKTSFNQCPTIVLDPGTTVIVFDLYPGNKLMRDNIRSLH